MGRDKQGGNPPVTRPTFVAVVGDFPQVDKVGSYGDIVDLVWIPYLDSDALAQWREELGEDHLLVPDGFRTAFLDRSFSLRTHRWIDLWQKEQITEAEAILSCYCGDFKGLFYLIQANLDKIFSSLAGLQLLMPVNKSERKSGVPCEGAESIWKGFECFFCLLLRLFNYCLINVGQGQRC